MTKLVPRPGILEIAAYVGGEAGLPGHNRVMRLASNENPLGCSPKARAAYEALAGELNRYPDGHATPVRRAIADRYGLDMARIVCGAGSDELLGLLMKAYCGLGDEIIHTRHGFAMYPIFARGAGATPVVADEPELKTDVDAILATVTTRTRAVFIANPNNPTSTYIDGAELRRLRACLPDNVLLVIDGAYAEYADAPDYDDGIGLVDESGNAVVTRTFSKIHGLAAVRLGWAYCPPDVADVLNRVRGPFNVTSAAIAAGAEAIRDEAFIARSVAFNNEWRERLTREVEAAGLEVIPGRANFLLIRFPETAGRTAADALAFLNGRGIIPRRMAGYGLPDCLRISIGLEDENRAVAEALTDFMRT